MTKTGPPLSIEEAGSEKKKLLGGGRDWGGGRTAVPSATTGNKTNPAMAIALHLHIRLIADNPPRKRVCFLFGLKGCMALKTLLCSGDDASPEQRSTLKAIDTLTPPPKAYPLAHGIVRDQFNT